MLLFLLGLSCGAYFGYLFGQAAARHRLPGCRPPRIYGAAAEEADPVSDFINEMQIGVSLLAENQRNCNLREAMKIKSDRRKLERMSSD